MSEETPKFTVGKLPNFEKNEEHLLKWASFLVEGDEMANALHLLEKCVPAFYRDHPTKAMVELRRKIRQQLMTTEDYIKNDQDDPCPDETALKACTQLNRAKIAHKVIKEYNDQNVKPHIVDLGPGDYWMALGFKQQGLDFTYRPVGLQLDAASQVKERLEGIITDYDPYAAPIIFVAYEIIEHLWNPHEIGQIADKLNAIPKKILISTPLYTFGAGNDTWTKDVDRGKLGHIRTFTPMEFQSEVLRMFHGYKWQMHLDAVMVLEGTLNEC